MSAAYPRGDAHAIRAFNFIKANPAGVTKYEVAEHLGLSVGYTEVLIHRLREVLGNTEDVNIPAEPPGYRGPWYYKVVGTMDETQPWADFMLANAETRIETLHSTAKSMVSATDARTREGRKVRAIAKQLGRLIEDLDDIALNHAP